MRTLACLFGISLFLLSALSAEEAALARTASVVHLDVSLPITGKTVLPLMRVLDQVAEDLKKEDRARQSAERGRNEGDVKNDVALPVPPTLILQFLVAPNQEKFGRGSTFGACYDLADFISSERFGGVRTVAFFPQSVHGHALLVALACDEIIVSEAAQIGDAGCDEPNITATMRQGYLEISGRRRKLPAVLVEKLLDPQIILATVETEKGTRWGKPEELERLRNTETFISEPEIVLPLGQPGLFTGTEARKQRLADLLSDDLIGVARGIGVRPDQIRPAPLVGQHGHAVRIDLVGPITGSKCGEIMRQLESLQNTGNLKGLKRGDELRVDFVCLYIDSPGGDLNESMNLIGYLLRDVDPKKLRTVAYVPGQALADAALIALACHETVAAPKALIGGDGASAFSREEIDVAREMLIDLLGKEGLRSWSIPAGMIDPKLEIFKATRRGARPVSDFFSPEELAQQPDADQWVRGAVIKPADRTFQTTGKKGLDLRLIDRNAADFTEFKTLYHLENDPTLLEPGWADAMVRILATPQMALFLLILGVIGLYGELQTPGIGVGAMVAVICFALFFWSRFLGGTVGWLEIVLFLVGVSFILMELFVLPGFGLFGITGAGAIVLSVVFASQTFIIPRNSYQLGQLHNSLLVMLVAVVGVLIAGALAARMLHEANKPKDNETVAESEKLADYGHLLGTLGVATTLLVPGGKARLGDEIYSVVSDGEVIEPETPVQVIAVQGYRIVVAAATPLRE